MVSHSTASSTSTDSSFSSTSSSTGASYTLILEHVFQYPGTYELKAIPLRTMYTINAEPRVHQASTAALDASSFTGNSSSSSQRAAAQAATAQFSSALINHIARIPAQPCSLPPSFVTNFLLKSFPLELEFVDFPQALTGLDYLRDLERRRRRETEASLRRLGIEPGRLGHPDDISTRHTGVAAWLQSTERAEKKVETLYTQVYIGLRRWILINELSLQPFNKHNCLAMLNTLYPPSSPNSMPPSPTTTQTTIAPSSTAPNPTTTLTPTVLKNQRDAFFKWTRTVEAKGCGILQPLMAPDKRHPQDTTGWPAVHETLDAYLRVTNHIIEEHQEVESLEDFDKEGLKRNRKKDSGISFGSGHESKQSNGAGSFDKNKALPTPPAPAFEDFEDLRDSRQGVNHIPEKGLSRLEKVARELRRIKLTRAANQRAKTDDYEEETSAPASPGTSQTHSRNNSDNSNDYPPSRNPSQPPSPTRGRSATTTTRAETRHHLNLRRSFSRNRVEAPLPSPSIDEMPRPPTSGSIAPSINAGGNGSKALRKLRSFSDIKRPSTSAGESKTDAYAAFDKQEMLKAKAAWEARDVQRREDEWVMQRSEEIGTAY